MAVAGDSDAWIQYGPVSGTLSTDDADTEFLDFWSVKDIGPAGDLDGNGTTDLWIDGHVLDLTVFAYQEEVLLIPLPQYGDVDPVAVATGRLVPEQWEGDPCNGWTTWHRNGDSDTVGDLDGDGFQDHVVSTYNWDDDTPEPGEACMRGIVYVAHGPVTGTRDLATDAVHLTGESESYTGGEVAAAGDVNGDGLADFLTTAEEPHTVLLVYGPATTSGAIVDQAVGISSTGIIEGGGDVDGDGPRMSLWATCARQRSSSSVDPSMAAWRRRTPTSPSREKGTAITPVSRSPPRATWTATGTETSS